MPQCQELKGCNGSVTDGCVAGVAACQATKPRYDEPYQRAPESDIGFSPKNAQPGSKYQRPLGGPGAHPTGHRYLRPRHPEPPPVPQPATKRHKSPSGNTRISKSRNHVARRYGPRMTGGCTTSGSRPDRGHADRALTLAVLVLQNSHPKRSRSRHHASGAAPGRLILASLGIG